MAAPRLLIVFTLAVLGVVLVVAALAGGSWWLLAVAVLALAIGTVVAVAYFGKTLAQGDKPDPVTAARLEEDDEGPRDDSSGDDRGDEPRMAI